MVATTQKYIAYLKAIDNLKFCDHMQEQHQQIQIIPLKTFPNANITQKGSFVSIIWDDCKFKMHPVNLEWVVSHTCNKTKKIGFYHLKITSSK